ncbi:MAG: 16S rRNA (uracil(1498)-N(3))-methyltransferase [Alicyclobacillaceae bacterium]|nr:16S rRNA (uracil(1498)-N(3))-methyltransferase [Alicyclobacillaceae bacterium]
MMPRVFWPGPLQPGQSVTVGGDDGHHFARVLRVRPGEVVAVAASTGAAGDAAGRRLAADSAVGDSPFAGGSPFSSGVYLAEVEAVDPREGEVRIRVGQPLPSREATHRVYVVQGLAKGDKIELIVQKCTEVGVAGIVVTPAERSVARLPADRASQRLERWRKVAREAAAQAQRDRVPEVWFLETGQLAGWLEALGRRQVLLLDEAAAGWPAVPSVREGDAYPRGALGLRAALRRCPEPGDGAASGEAAATVLVVGPEGGWTDAERRLWQDQFGAVAVSLGPRILRTETAGVVAASAVLYEYGELGG